MVSGKVVFPSAEVCIYCGKDDDLSTEHIIPSSLDGRIEIPRASCKSCRDITSNNERLIAREWLKLGRSKFNYPTRRPRERMSHVFADTYDRFSSKRIKIPVEFASFNPNGYRLIRVSKEGEIPIFSRVQGAAIFHADGDKAVKAYSQKTRKAVRMRIFMPSAETFIQFLWKIASGFFWHYDRVSYLSSQARARAINVLPSTIAEWFSVEGRFEEHPFVKDVFQEGDFSIKKRERGANANVFCSLDRKSVFCRIDILGDLGFPVYVCRIDRCSENS